MEERRRIRRYIASGHNEDELGKMKHTHDFAGTNSSSRRSPSDISESASLLLPLLNHKSTAPSNLFNGKVAARVVQKPGSVIQWKDSLRRDVLMLPSISCLRSKLAHESHTNDVDEVNEVKEMHGVNRDITTKKMSDDIFLVSLSKKKVAKVDRNDTAEESALETLRNLFLPRWRFFLHLKHRLIQPVVVSRSVSSAEPPRRPSRVRDLAVDVILSFLRGERVVPLAEFRRWRQKLIAAQRLFRRHMTAIDARVELNYRRLRATVEESYWRRAATHGGLGGGDAADLNSACRLPEPLLRRELRAALYSHIQRSLQPPPSQEEEEEEEQHQRQRKRQTKQSLQLQKPRITAFLPLPTFYAVLDNVCYITSVLRNSKLLREHLSERSRVISSY
ncbi:hypothetical protein LSM04_002052 [Trypanosoma melophagium]|uniref:uncharacterized protein n=1 Tax=Trypanosoma melophagium TaxID=715481 RepID=UPI00351A72FC|nr:hypothetical protein LSM04_002052 [Trypanosoma melophagium]